MDDELVRLLKGITPSARPYLHPGAKPFDPEQFPDKERIAPPTFIWKNLEIEIPHDFEGSNSSGPFIRPRSFPDSLAHLQEEGFERHLRPSEAIRYLTEGYYGQLKGEAAKLYDLLILRNPDVWLSMAMERKPQGWVFYEDPVGITMFRNRSYRIGDEFGFHDQGMVPRLIHDGSPDGKHMDTFFSFARYQKHPTAPEFKPLEDACLQDIPPLMRSMIPDIEVAYTPEAKMGIGPLRLSDVHLPAMAHSRTVSTAMHYDPAYIALKAIDLEPQYRGVGRAMSIGVRAAKNHATRG